MADPCDHCGRDTTGDPRVWISMIGGISCDECREEKEKAMTEPVEITVFPAKTKVEALEKFGPIAMAMATAHATMLRLALYAKDATEREAHLRDARDNLVAQMSLAQIEMFIHNMPDSTT